MVAHRTSRRRKTAEIVECAARLFREFGVDNVSVAKVMSAADMTIGGFYKHFESKDALVEEVSLLPSSNPRYLRKVSNANTTIRASYRRHRRLLSEEERADQACPMIAFAPT